MSSALWTRWWTPCSPKRFDEVSSWVSGEGLIREIAALEKIAAEPGLTPLSLFDSANRDAEFLARLENFDGDPDDLKALPHRVQWFAPEDGLETVRGLLAFLQAGGAKAGTIEPAILRQAVIEELKDLAKQLQCAAARGVKFQLAVS